MLAKRMGKPRVIAETGAGMHGVATATMCAKFGLECVVFMGAIDVARQQPNVLRMRALGAEGGAGRVRREDAQGRDERGAARLGHQCREHVLLHRHGRRPASLSDDGARLPVRHRRRDARADAGGRRPAAGLARSPASAAARTPWACSIPFLDDRSVEIYGVEAAGHGLDETSTPPRSPAAGPACCTAIAPTS